MIKECEILFKNPFLNIVVVDFDGLKIQLTGNVDEGEKTTYVKYANGVATIVSKKEYDKSLNTKVSKPKKNIDIDSDENGEKYNSEL